MTDSSTMREIALAHAVQIHEGIVTTAGHVVGDAAVFLDFLCPAQPDVTAAAPADPPKGSFMWAVQQMETGKPVKRKRYSFRRYRFDKTGGRVIFAASDNGREFDGVADMDAEAVLATDWEIAE